MGYLLQQARVQSASAPYSFLVRDVAISDEGIIEKIAPSIPIAAFPSSSYERIKADGHVLLPGLVNAHSHAAMSILRGVGDDLHLMDWLGTDIWPREKKMTAADVRAGTNLACIEMIASGITTFNDMYFHMDAVAESVAESGMRAMLGYGMIDLGDYEGKGRKELQIGEEFVRAWNGKSQGRITCSIAPHAPHTCSTELLQAAAKLAHSLKCYLHIHAAETRKELAVVLAKTKKRPIEYLDACGCLTSTTVLAHGVYATKSEVLLMAKRKTSLAHCPVSNLKLASGGAAPVPQYLEAEVNLALGTDGAASNNSLDIFQSMKVGAIEQKNFHFDASVVKADDYLQMGSEGGANALGVKAGVIKTGYLADLILIDAHSANLVPFTNNAGWLVYSAGPQNVTDVMVSGKWLMRERKLLTLDKEKVLEKAQREAENITDAHKNK